MNIAMTRREFAALAGAVVLSPPASAQTGELMTRAIPSSGERLPAVGLGTAYVFDRNDETTRQKAAAVVQALVAGGGSLIDTSSAYGDAEAVLGEVIAVAALRDKLFTATKGGKIPVPGRGDADVTANALLLPFPELRQRLLRIAHVVEL
jgi:aryl-alcohol dehydrogenase-like predicted oxidoreductase